MKWVWFWLAIIITGWLFILGWVIWFYRPDPVVTFREIDISHVQGKKSAPGRMAPRETSIEDAEKDIRDRQESV